MVDVKVINNLRINNLRKDCLPALFERSGVVVLNFFTKSCYGIIMPRVNDFSRFTLLLSGFKLTKCFRALYSTKTPGVKILKEYM